nr:serine/threonine-protein kinase/endoribonuclease IRE1b-like isoform X2 [Tanacetum cinerariifolium]
MDPHNELDDDENILKPKELESLDLITNLLHPIPDFRPTAVEVYHHPLFWNPEFRLSFLRDASDYVDVETTDSSVLKALESISTIALGGKWDEKLDKILLKDITWELSEEVQEVLGSVPTGFESYFSSRFPKLLMEVYKVLKPFCAEEEVFHKYYKVFPALECLDTDFTCCHAAAAAHKQSRDGMNYVGYHLLLFELV